MRNTLAQRHVRSLLALAAIVTGTLGCRDRTRTEATARETIAPRVAAAEDVLAHVNGVPVLAADVLAQKQSGRSFDACVQAAIQQELLSQEAERRGLAVFPEVLRTRQQALVNRLIQTDFAVRFTKRDIPQKLLQEAYALNQMRYDHPEMVSLSHLVILANRNHSEAFHQKVLYLASKVHRLATQRPLSEEEFKAIADVIRKDDESVVVRAETFTTPQRGLTTPSFADQAFKLTLPGQISPVFQTEFGYHVVRYKDRIAAVHRPLADVADEIRDRVFDEARSQAFVAWVERLRQEHKARVSEHAALLLAAGKTH